MSILIATVNVLWLLSPLVLVGLGLRDWKRKRHDATLVDKLPLPLGVVLLSEWALFVYFLFQSATPYGMYFHTSSSTTTLLVLSLVVGIAAFTARAGVWQLALSSASLVSLWVCIAYAPAHYLRRVDFGAITVDGHAVPSHVYLGHPTDMEAEAFALVRLDQGSGEYLFDFDSGKYRFASKWEYVRIPGGIWYLRSMQGGAFAESLAPQKLNQLRVRSRDGHFVTFQF